MYIEHGNQTKENYVKTPPHLVMIEFVQFPSIIGLSLSNFSSNSTSSISRGSQGGGLLREAPLKRGTFFQVSGI